jgi:periplasmic protein TonB
MTSSMFRIASLCVAAAVLLAACKSAPPPPPPAAPVASGAAAPPAARPGSYGSVMEYRRAAGNAIYTTNASMRSTGTLPALLRSIVVLEIEVDGNGRLAVARVKRSGADPSLDPVALDTLRRTPLPAPSRNLLNRRGTVEYFETWFFDAGGKFQLMAFNPPQARE